MRRFSVINASLSSVVRCAAFLLLFSTLLSCAQSLVTPKLRVTIIAINKFDDPKLQDKDLTDAITANADALRKYFEETFKITVNMIWGDHAQDSDIREWLRSDLRVDSDKSINLIFVITHGLPRTGNDEKTNDSEIYLAASNTLRDRPTRNSISGIDLIMAIKDAPKRNTFFLFIDACGSGAIDGDQLEEVLQADRDLASRLMILASSSPDEKSYRARFTEALRTIWTNKDSECSEENLSQCHCGPTIEPYLTGEIKKIPGVSPDVEQNVQLVSQYFPDFCIELFGVEQRLLFLFNAAPGESQVTLVTPPNNIAPIKMKRGATHPVNLNSREYTFVAKRLYRRDSKSRVMLVDLKKFPADVEVLFGDEVDRVAAIQSTAIYLQSHQIATKFAHSLRVASSARVLQLATKVKVQEDAANKQIDQLTLQYNAAATEASEAENGRQQSLSKLRQYGTAEIGCAPGDEECKKGLEKMRAEVADLNARMEAGSKLYKQKLTVESEMRKQITDATAVKAKFADRNDKLIRLKTVAQQFDDDESVKKRFLDHLNRSAQGQWTKNIVLNTRGINLSYPPPYLLAAEDLSKIVEFVNQERWRDRLQVEIEVPELRETETVATGQDTALGIARSIRDQLRIQGLKTTRIAARTFLSTSGEENFRVIISPFWPSDFAQ
jgi:hypothetical protein